MFRDPLDPIADSLFCEVDANQRAVSECNRLLSFAQWSLHALRDDQRKYVRPSQKRRFGAEFKFSALTKRNRMRSKWNVIIIVAFVLSNVCYGIHFQTVLLLIQFNHLADKKHMHCDIITRRESSSH